MSGRWRSRHWRSGEGDQPHEIRNPSRERPQQHGHNNGGRSREYDGSEIRDRSRERQQQQHGHNNEERGRGEYDGFNHRRDDNQYRRSDGPEFHQQRQHQQQQQPYQSNNMPRDDRGAWRRGQTLSSSSSSSSGAATRGGQGERTASAGRNDERRINKQEQASSASRSGSAGRSSARPTFPAPPTQAWGNKPSGTVTNTNGPVQLDSKTNNSSTESNNRNIAVKAERWGKPDAEVVAKKQRWGEPDSIKSPAEEVKVVEKKQNTNAWAKPNPTPPKAVGSSTQNTTPSPAEASSAKSFPTGIIKRADRGSSNPWAKQLAPISDAKPMATDNPAFPPAGPGGGNNKTPTAPKETTPSPSLPSTSSWGKSQPSAQSSSGWAKLAQKEKKPKANEFPSLSMSSKMPRTQPQQGQKHPPTAKAVVTPAKGKGAGSSKKNATSKNLASFLPPPTSSGAASGKGSKKKQALQKSTLKKGNTTNNKPNSSHPGMASMVGMKRSAPSSSAPGNHHHRGIGGGEFPTGSKGGVTKKGRQRLAPRKKKLTTLKKKVLKERLRVWKEQNGIVDDDVGAGVASEGQGLTGNEPNVKRLKTDGTASNEAASVTNSTTLLVENFIRPEEDDLADEDEYDEIISNLISLAGRVGKVLSVFVPRGHQSSAEDDGMEEQESSAALPAETKHVGLAFVRFATNNDVCAAKDILDGMVVGGQKIHTTILKAEEMVQFNNDNSAEEGGAAVVVAPSAQNDRLWRLTVLSVMDDRQTSMDESNDLQTNSVLPSAQQQLGASSSAATTTIIFHKILCDDDYEDEEALQESIEDIKGLAQQYGQVEGARAATSGDDKGNVFIVYENNGAAERAVQQLNGLVVGGSKIVVSTNNKDLPQEQQESRVGELVLCNVLNDDDFEDEDCFNESMEDIRNLARKYGNIGDVKAEVSGEHKGRVRVSYLDGHEVAQQAAQKLNGLVVGGLTISASVVSSAAENISNAPIDDKDPPMQEKNKSEPPPPPPPPMYSGDKIVPEQFAACKRVPKIPNPGTPRAYATKITGERATPTLIEMLGELMRLQERSKDDKNARARRRLVMGLREVARGIRAHKVKMVIMANNLDDYGAIDSKLQEILDLARGEDLPVLFELNKRKLGKALGKSIKVSVVGIQNADGAHEQFKKLKKMMGKA
mmetsp:Transcript_35826/g.65710  ORF Transcript_35826/g.65710 Transcript_35826/m.65710 type:complete len:1163 (-) Transcript_35826:21-3509(-)